MPKLTTMRIVSLFVIAIAGYAFYLTLGYPRGAAMLPRALLILLAICAATLIVRRPDGQGETLGIKHRARVLLGAALCIGYVLAIHGIGYYAASVVFVIVLAAVLRYRKYHWVAVTAIGYPLTIYLIFEYFLKIPMPQAAWL